MLWLNQLLYAPICFHRRYVSYFMETLKMIAYQVIKYGVKKMFYDLYEINGDKKKPVGSCHFVVQADFKRNSERSFNDPLAQM